MERLKGKVAIVTGAGSGIGAATARLMAEVGASVLVADIDDLAARRVADTLGAKAVALRVDVSDESNIVRMIQMAVEVFGGLDVLHNNATDSRANATDTDIVTLDMELFDRLVAVNLKSVVMACKHAIPRMLERGGGAMRQSTRGVQHPQDLDRVAADAVGHDAPCLEDHELAGVGHPSRAPERWLGCEHGCGRQHTLHDPPQGQQRSLGRESLLRGATSAAA